MIPENDRVDSIKKEETKMLHSSKSDFFLKEKSSV
jgi:hypothetical protein